MGFAEVIKVNERTVRNWVGGRSDVPVSIAMLSNLMLDTKSTVFALRHRRASRARFTSP